MKTAIVKFASRQALLVSKNAPTIMFAGGVTGVIATTVLACRGTLKLDKVLAEAEAKHQAADAIAADPQHPNYTKSDAKKDHFTVKVELAQDLVKIYGPAVIVGVVSVGLLTRSHVILNQRVTALGAAYTALDKGFKQYRARVVEELGEDKDLEFRHGTEVIKESVETSSGTKTVEHRVLTPTEGSIYGRYFDESTSKSYSREPWKNLTFLKINQNYLNDQLKARGFLFLNEAYEQLGLSWTPEGQQVGWLLNGDGDGFVDFGVFGPDGEQSRLDRKMAFLDGEEKSIYLDFNVDGVIYHLLEGSK